MARYHICKHCGKFVELKVNTYHEAGMTFSSIVCPECGHIEKNNTNHIHYGNDGSH